MSYLDDYIEKIHYLPLEVNRNLRLIQELDRRASRARELLEQFQQDLLKSLQASGGIPANKKSCNFNEEQKKLIECIDKTQTEYYHLSEEKCKVADQIYQEIQIQHDELNNETKRFLQENPQVKANMAYQSPIPPQPEKENELVPSSLKKKKKNEEKKAQKIKEVNDNIDSYLNSPTKQQGGGSLNSSFQENHGYSHQYASNINSTTPYLQNGKLNGSSTNIDQLKYSKRQTKSKYSSQNREESKYCCGQKIDSNFIQCDKCQTWYHQKCVGIGENDVDISEDWFCSKCDKTNPDISSVNSMQGISKITPPRTAASTSVRKQSKLSNN
ncbi:hypothetical protein ABPG74_002472 [Tetrahymena malaccensis]